MNTIEITANGKTYAIPSGQLLADFLRAQDLDPGMVVVERNGGPVSPSETPSLQLADGDRLEIVQIVAGG